MISKQSLKELHIIQLEQTLQAEDMETYHSAAMPAVAWYAGLF